MSIAPRFCGVILAAGASSRMGRDKALLPWKDSNFLGSGIDMLNAVSELVLVIAGDNAAAIKPTVDTKAGFLFVNPQPENGQFSSLQRGLREVLNKGCDTAIVTLVDRPPVAAKSLLKLVHAFRELSPQGKWVVVPDFEGRHGHPIIISREMIEAFLSSPMTATAREVEHANQDRIVYIPVDDPMVTANVDTPEQYNTLVAATTQADPEGVA
jgi:molybdenum cofactor cytidylyltransferase